MHHSITKSVQAEAEELEVTKRRADALEKQLRELGVEPTTAAKAAAAAPATATVREYRMDNGARKVQIMATNGPAGALGASSMGPGTLIAEFDAVTRVRDEIEGDYYTCNVYAPSGQYDGNGKSIDVVVGQRMVAKGTGSGGEIIHVAKVQVHDAPTARAIEHQQLLIAQGKLRAPGAVKEILRPRELPEIVMPVEVGHGSSQVDEVEERFALIELGDKERP